MTDDELSLQRHLDEELNRLPRARRPVPTEAVYEPRGGDPPHAADVGGGGADDRGSARDGPAGPGLDGAAAERGWWRKRNRSERAAHRHERPIRVLREPGGQALERYCRSRQLPDRQRTSPRPAPAVPGTIRQSSPTPDRADSPTTYAVFFRSRDRADRRRDSAMANRCRCCQASCKETGSPCWWCRRRSGSPESTPTLRTGVQSRTPYPFAADGLAHFAMWYHPDQTPTQPEASGTITGVTQKGKPASVDVRIGPFGICYTVAQRPALGATADTNSGRSRAGIR